ncbi:MAG: BolA family transcriptional regulator [Proteobacteria bacterium]|nr:MAG: BolA family transcriptional regulator [Pseudomonadota bacterium]
MSTTVAAIETRLTEALAPLSLHIDDESALHAGHAGARDGGGHYRVDIVSAAFAGKNTVARHRLIYAALGDLMPRAIHALAIRASAPDEL